MAVSPSPHTASPDDSRPGSRSTQTSDRSQRTTRGIPSTAASRTLKVLREEVEKCESLDLVTAGATASAPAASAVPAGSPDQASAPTPAASPAATVRSQLEALWQDSTAEATALARRYRMLAPLWVDTRSEAGMNASDEIGVLLSHALRTTITVARRQLDDAHAAVENFPRTLAMLAEGVMPARWFTQMLHRSGLLEDEDREQLDECVASWSMAVSEERFRRELGRMIQLLLEENTAPLPEPERIVEIVPGPGNEGTACLQVTGPIPEILAVGRRLDRSAKAVQDAQRRALRENTEIPFDDGSVAGRGRPLSRARLRYEILTRSLLDTGPVQVPAERFRINVTIPMMTLLGLSNAPGEVEGTPIPAAMARCLAGDNPIWYRILTDPTTGAFLPLRADRYSPDHPTLEHLRLRNPTCALPGCVRPTSTCSEADHIIEFDHEHPEQGGPTSIENLHLLCWRHHQMKTMGLLDPVREDLDPPPSPDGASPITPPGRTRWEVPSAGIEFSAEDERDLFTPIIVDELLGAWNGFRKYRELLKKRRDAAEAAAKKAVEAARAAAEREELERQAEAKGDPPPPPPPPPPLPARDDIEAWGPDGPPPF